MAVNAAETATTRLLRAASMRAGSPSRAPYQSSVSRRSGNPALMSDPTLAGWNKAMKAGGEEAAKAQGELTKAQALGTLPAPVKDPKVVVPIMKSVWQQYTATAEKFNEPGRFTAMIGYEWTSVPGGNNLHRNVIFSGDNVPELPYTALESQNPEAGRKGHRQGQSDISQADHANRLTPIDEGLQCRHRVGLGVVRLHGGYTEKTSRSEQR